MDSDGERSLWEVLGSTKSIESTQLELREPSGCFVEVGPLSPPAGSEGPPAGNTGGGENEYIDFVGSSATSSHVLFTIWSFEPELLWPGDTTLGEAKSLYKYVGTGNARPMLVGVNNEGHLISNCGTHLGSTFLENGGGDSYNAVSANGETVFFTPGTQEECGFRFNAPEVNELYARLDQVRRLRFQSPRPAHANDVKRRRGAMRYSRAPLKMARRLSSSPSRNYSPEIPARIFTSMISMALRLKRSCGFPAERLGMNHRTRKCRVWQGCRRTGRMCTSSPRRPWRELTAR